MHIEMTLEDMGDRLIRLTFISSGLRQVSQSLHSHIPRMHCAYPHMLARQLMEDDILGTSTKVDNEGMLQYDIMAEGLDDMKPSVKRCVSHVMCS